MYMLVNGSKWQPQKKRKCFVLSFCGVAGILCPLSANVTRKYMFYANVFKKHEITYKRKTSLLKYNVIIKSKI